MQELEQYMPQSQEIDIVDPQSLTMATSILSQLNKQLDAITAHKEQKTKPLNEALGKIRDDYRPYETRLKQAIDMLRSKMNTYATKQIQSLKEKEEKILVDRRTSIETKITKLSNIEQPSEKVETDQGKITFITVKKWRVVSPNDIPRAFLIPNEEAVKQAMKENQPIKGIEYYEEQSLRNYR